jgi:sugar-specific transcriptional regulator TrmB
MADAAYQALTELGFSDYEARAYCALLHQFPANGYQISQRSGIPRAKIYECLERLVERGAVVRMEGAEDGAKLFTPTDFRELLDESEANSRAAHERARKALAKHGRSPRAVEVLWRVNSRQDLIRRGHKLISGAKKALHVALWPEEFEALAPELLAALKRGVRMALILYSPDPTPNPALAQLQKLGAGAIQHSRSKGENVPVLGRQFVLAVDYERGITGSVFEGGDVEGIFSLNRGLVTNAVDLVNHEIYLERILTEAGSEVIGTFGEDLAKLNAFDVPRAAGAPGRQQRRFSRR